MKRLGILCLVFVLAILGSSSAPLSTSAAPNAAAASAQALGITTGIYQAPTANYGTEMNTVNSLTGTTHGILLYYLDWSTPFQDFLQKQLNLQMAAANVPVLMLGWGPANGKASLGCDKDYAGAVPFSQIIAGKCDTYIRNYATALKARPERFLLKFAHEMNGGGQPWSSTFVGVAPSTFVSMWRHVHDIFVQVGVTNVEWVWGPIYISYPNTAANDLHLYYPGNDYVDWVGPLGYNYYNQMLGAPQPWYSFTTIFDSLLKDFACQYAKPQIVNEFGSVEDASGANSKTAWIADAFAQAPNYPFLRGLVWYNGRDNGNPNADFRITSATWPDGSVAALPLGSGTWTSAYKSAVSASVYTHNLPSLASATPPGTYCGGSSGTSLAVQPSAVVMQRSYNATLTFQGWMYSSALSLSLGLPSGVGITGTVNPTQLSAPWGKATIQLTTSASATYGTYDATLHTGSTDVPFRIAVVPQVRKQFLPLIQR